MRRARDNGFALIELLVVMIIIGLLAGIAIPVLLSQKSKAKEASIKSDVSVIAKDVTSYYVDGKDALAISGGPGGQFALTDRVTAATIDSGRLSPQNSVSVTSGVGSEMSWCVAVTNADVATSWKVSANSSGLVKGLCP